MQNAYGIKYVVCTLYKSASIAIISAHLDLEYESYTHSLQIDALIMNSLTSIHLCMCLDLHFRLRNRQKYSLFTAYVKELSFFEFNHFSNINGFFY